VVSAAAMRARTRVCVLSAPIVGLLVLLVQLPTELIAPLGDHDCKYHIFFNIKKKKKGKKTKQYTPTMT
jgi:hypothetical protein